MESSPIADSGPTRGLRRTELWGGGATPFMSLPILAVLQIFGEVTARMWVGNNRQNGKNFPNCLILYELDTDLLFRSNMCHFQ